MTKCPDHETLSLFVDGELDNVELDNVELEKVRQHVECCRKCRIDLQNMQEEEALLRSGINEAFSRHGTSVKIMEEIRSNPDAKVALSPAGSFWSMFAVRAVALMLVVLIGWFMASYRPRYHGTVMSVACQALNTSSTINGVTQLPRQNFVLSHSSAAVINGHFLFSVIATSTSEFEVKGQSEVTLDRLNQPVFSNAEVKLLWVKGPELRIRINEELVLINQAQHNESTASAAPPLEQATASLMINQAFASDSLNIDGIVDIASEGKDCPVSATEISSSGKIFEEIASEGVLIDNGHLKEFNNNPFSEEPIGINGN